ncbi:hypothetical protein ACHQM5_021534 [Ranunculus cassubicifolius]
MTCSISGLNKRNKEENEITNHHVFECKTCNRYFASFQALGGHRASHKKPRLMPGEDTMNQGTPVLKTKTHECSICGLEFAIGQALGGHMRRHTHEASQKFSHISVQMPTVKKAKGRRVLCLDLNLSPLENEFALQFVDKQPQKSSLPVFEQFF